MACGGVQKKERGGGGVGDVVEGLSGVPRFVRLAECDILCLKV